MQLDAYMAGTEKYTVSVQYCSGGQQILKLLARRMGSFCMVFPRTAFLSSNTLFAMNELCVKQNGIKVNCGMCRSVVRVILGRG